MGDIKFNRVVCGTKADKTTSQDPCEQDCATRFKGGTEGVQRPNTDVGDNKKRIAVDQFTVVMGAGGAEIFYEKKKVDYLSPGLGRVVGISLLKDENSDGVPELMVHTVHNGSVLGNTNDTYILLTSELPEKTFSKK